MVCSYLLYYSENSDFSVKFKYAGNNTVFRSVKMVQTPSNSYCMEKECGVGCCKVEAIISIDDRGQMILPKEVRDKAKIKPQDKLVVISFERGEDVCCIGLIKVESLTEMVKDMLGPVMKEVLKISQET